jgi:DNA-binding response OmpR family regulator
MRKVARHRILLVEDDVETLESIARMVEDVFDFECIAVRSFTEARAVIDEGNFCLLITDLGIVATPQSGKPEAELGHQLIEHARKCFPNCNAENWHLLTILVLSSLDSGNLRQGMRSGADDFLTKPIGSNRVSLRDTIHEWLQKTGRHDHAQCAEIMARARRKKSTAPPAPLAVAAAGPRLGVTGRTFGKKSEITIDGQAARLLNALFGPLLRLIEGRLAKEEWTTREELGAEAGAGWKGASGLQKELGPLLGGRPLLVNNRDRGYRLDPSVELDAIVVAPLVGEGRDLISRTARRIAALRGKTKRAGT